MQFQFPDWQPDKWHHLPENPIIAPPDYHKWPGVIGDPQVLLPGEFDDMWHMFCIGHGRFFRYDSSDGVAWDLIYTYEWKSGPVSLTHDGTQWVVFYSHHKGWWECSDCGIAVRTSQDLENWSEPEDVILPELDWECEGKAVQLRNPCLVALPDGRFRLYYSGGTVWMHDMGFEEPKYVSFAESDSMFGPYVKHGEPVLAPDPGKPYRSYGAGAMKVFRYGDIFLGLSNGIYLDEEEHSHSAIDVLLSEDGIVWEDAPYNPIISPEGDGWKKSLIYQLDLRWYDGKLWLYYNTREGWSHAKEWIGCSTLEWDGMKPEKMWHLPR